MNLSFAGENESGKGIREMAGTGIVQWVQYSKARDDDRRLANACEVFICKNSPLVAYLIKDKSAIENNSTYDYRGIFKYLKEGFGVYFLTDESNPKGKTVYVGKGDLRNGKYIEGMDRLYEHVKKNCKDSYKDDWKCALYITSRDEYYEPWTTADTANIEKAFIALFYENKDYILLNSKDGSDGSRDKQDTIINCLQIAEALRYILGYDLSNKIDGRYSHKQVEETEINAKLQAIEWAKHELYKDMKAEAIEDLERIHNLRNYKHIKEESKNLAGIVINGRQYDPTKSSKDMDVMTPNEESNPIVDKMLGLAKDSDISTDTTFLNLYSKDGIFCKRIIDRLMKHETSIANPIQRLNNIIKNQIYIVCGTIQAWARTMNNLTNYIDEIYAEYYKDGLDFETSNTLLPNIYLYENIKYDLKNGHINETAEKIRKYFNSTRGGAGTVKFDVVIGNPPYNNDIYLDFVTLGHQLANNCSIWITPAKWQAKGGPKNEEFRKNIVPHMSKIVYYPDTREVFDIDSQGGISYFHLDKDEHKNKQLKTICSVQKLFQTNDIEICSGNYVLYNNKIQSIISKLGKYTQLYCKNNAIDKRYNVAITNTYSEKNCTSKSGKAYVTISPYIQTDTIRNNADTSFLDSFADLESAKSYVSYLQTKFIRFMFLMAKCSLHMQSNFSWRFVPDPGSFDHIFTDAELYKKYNLTPEEINIIESVIKAR